MNDVKIGVITCFGAKENEIMMIENADYTKLSRTFLAIMDKVYDNNEQGKKTFIFLYYAGHGEMDLFTFAMLNANTKDKYRFPLEQQLRTLGRIEGAYVIAVFDCCRSHVNPALRGNGVQPDVEGPYQNFFMSYGCAPNNGVDLVSTIAV